jgi:hypothetical protein
MKTEYYYIVIYKSKEFLTNRHLYKTDKATINAVKRAIEHQSDWELVQELGDRATDNEPNAIYLCKNLKTEARIYVDKLEVRTK